MLPWPELLKKGKFNTENILNTIKPRLALKYFEWYRSWLCALKDLAYGGKTETKRGCNWIIFPPIAKDTLARPFPLPIKERRQGIYTLERISPDWNLKGRTVKLKEEKLSIYFASVETPWVFNASGKMVFIFCWWFQFPIAYLHLLIDNNPECFLFHVCSQVLLMKEPSQV